MFFKLGRNGHSPPGHLEMIPGWYVVYGSLDNKSREKIIWQDRKIAFVSSENFSVSSKQRFILMGDIWLSNRRQLLEKLCLDNHTEISDQQIVAQLWEKYNHQSLTMLLGMFNIVIWDRNFSN